jgi:hypothetical protein
MGQSEDGARVLFDRITRHVGLAQRIEEDALILPSMGMSTDGDSPNGELVSVVDTGSGKQCFEWQIKDEFIDELSRHADIDPSGRLVAIISRGTLGIYRLPDICAAK